MVALVQLEMGPNFTKSIRNSARFDIITLNYFYYYFKLSGIATIRISHTLMHETGKWKWSFHFSKISIFYNVYLMSLLVIMYIFAYNDIVKSGFGGRFIKDKVIIAIFHSLIILTTALILVIYCIKQKKVIAIANKISEAKYFQKLPPINVENNHHTLLLSFANISIFLYSVLIAIHQKPFYIIYSIAFRSCLFIIDSLLIQYSVMVKLMQNFFDCINKKLLQVTAKISEFHGIQSVYNCSTVISEFDILMHFYRIISNSTEKISEFYSLPMLWSLLAIFIEVLMCLYHMIKQVYISNDILNTFNLYILSFVAFQFTLLTTLTMNVTDAIKKVKYSF